MTGGKIQTTLLLWTLTVGVACEKKLETSSPGTPAARPTVVRKSKQDAKDALTTTTAYLVRQKEQLQKSLGQRMSAFDKRLSDLKAKSGKAGDLAKSEWTNTLGQLQRKKEAAAEKLEQLKNSSTEKWQEIKVGAESAFADLEKGLKDAWTRSRDDVKSGKK
jgi:hypothetical protein